MLSLVNYLKWTPIIKWYVVGRGFKNGNQEDMCLNKIEPLAHNTISIVSSNSQHN